MSQDDIRKMFGLNMNRKYHSGESRCRVINSSLMTVLSLSLSLSSLFSLDVRVRAYTLS